MDFGHVTDDKTMAERRRDLMYLDRSKTLKLLEGDEWGRGKLAEMGRTLKPGMTPLETVDRQLGLLWEQALAAAGTVQMRGVVRPADGLVAVFLPREEMAASCESFADGSGLVSVSDTLLSMTGRLAMLNALGWRSGGWQSLFGRRRRGSGVELTPDVVMESPSLMAGTAALRYAMQHIRIWGKSAAVQPRRATSGLRYGVWGTLFVLAHEIGHFMLGHDVTPADERSPAEREFEADEFALHAILGALGSLGRAWAGSAALLALCAVQVWESAAFLRDVRLHPSIPDRWTALREILGDSAVRAEGNTTAARLMTATASSRGSLPSEFWDALCADRRFETPHGLEYLRMIQGLDGAESMTLGQRHEMMGRLASESSEFLEGWQALCSQGWEAGCSAWSIDSAGILDPLRPLSYWQVVNRIASAPAWGDAPDLIRRSAAYVAVHARPEELRAIS